MTTNSLRGPVFVAVCLAGSLAHADDPLPEGSRLPTESAEVFHGSRATFQQAIERSLRQNPSLLIAVEELKRSKALMEQIASSSLPTLSANGGYTRLDHNRYAPGTTPPDSVLYLGENTVTANLTFAAPLLAPKSWAQWSHAHDNTKVSVESVADARRQIAIMSGHAYLTVLSQRKLVEVARLARDSAIAQHDYAKARFVGGVGTRIDEVRAAQELATDESQLAASFTNLRRAREALGVLMGEEGPVDAADEPPLDDEDSLKTTLDDADHRSDVRVASTRLWAAHRVTRDSYTDYLPLITGEFQPFYQNPPSSTVPHTGWQAIFALTIPLYDGGLRYGQRRERSSLEAEAKATLEGTLRQARSEVRVAFAAVREADHAFAAARDAARLAKEAFELATIAYRGGAATNIELIDAERQSRDASAQAALSEDASRQARLDLLTASGRFPDGK
jgi:outer membrane protein TolC